MPETPEPPSSAAAPAAGAAGQPGQPAWTPSAAPVPFPMLLDEAMRWTRASLRRIYLPFALPVAALSCIMLLAQGILPGPRAGLGADPMQSLAHSCSLMLIILPLNLAIGLFQAAMSVAATEMVAGRGADAGRALRFMLQPAVWLTLLLMLLCDTMAATCCLLPVLYVAPLLSMTTQVMVVEGPRGLAALRRSAQLTRHNPRGLLMTSPILKVLALMLVTFLIAFLVSLLPQLPFTILNMGSMLRKIAAGEEVRQLVTPWVQAPLSFFGALASMVVSLYSSFAFALLFFDLRSRREGGDLERAIAAMTGATTGTTPAPSSPAALPPAGLPPGGAGGQEDRGGEPR